MKIRTSARVAALAAAALSLSILGTSAASASDTDAPIKSGTGSYSYTPPAAPKADALKKVAPQVEAVSEIPVFDITSVHVEDGVLFQRGFNSIESVMEYSFAGTPEQIDIIKPLIGIGGSARGRTLLMPWDAVWPTNEFALLSKANYGVGKSRLGSFEIHYSDGTVGVDNVKSNYFQIRVATDGVINVARSGSTVKFALKIVKFHPSKGKYVGNAGAKAYIQYAAGGSWATLKRVTLDKNGRAKYSFKPNSPHVYRVYVPTTSNILGGQSNGVGPL